MTSIEDQKDIRDAKAAMSEPGRVSLEDAKTLMDRADKAMAAAIPEVQYPMMGAAQAGRIGHHYPRPSELAKALAAAQGEMSGAKKDSNNPFFGSKYADLASVVDAIRGPFSKHGLAIIQKPSVRTMGEPQPYEWKAKSGETRYGVRVPCEVTVRTIILHVSGEREESALSCLLPTADPQSVGSAITYLRRYDLQAMAGIAPEDDDGEAAMNGGQKSKPFNFTTILPPPDVDAVMEAAKAAWTGSGIKPRDAAAYVNSIAKGLDDLTVEALIAAVKAAPAPK